ncbi:prophage tail fiber N-terminal domain-containing protein [Escherichia coli]|uniref:prophage tail fiber N-terminal domain-containing protein n=3 Tax=Escherichia coli TaxID=562 RepID=UPI001582EA57|nr:prophage tail fiber N-terminal domain-containing protein [Escherichia coli]EFW7477382.1 phage tail protein [Shigella sonnei]EFC2087775.1 phage tail protein [Escherichia coli]ELP8817329.1 prophage tail fiber N-terminal domain-containing protein [Escherichia coli]EMF1797042.1 prophage tail fiber N-terminal domain-containing protein [Escherichia coli]MBH9600351.1 prophage tail fiber N-terminal domain-containing protein [Escherichia coli]
MAVKISGVLKDGAGKPVVNCAIELRARRTSPTVVAHVVATCVTDNNGAYVIEAEPGYYEVALNRNGWQPTRVGDIYVAPTDTPGTLNAFLDAPKDGDLRPEVMKRFEEMVDVVTRQSEQVTDDRKRAESAADTATNAATSALDSKNKAEELKNQAQQSAEAAAKSEKNAKSHADNAAGSASQYKEAASSAATSAENAANVALGHENNAAEYARQAKASQDASAGNAQEAKQHRDEAQRIVDDLKGSNASTTEKGLVQLCSDTDNDSEELAATPKAVKTVMDETKTKAPLDSPAFTGTPTTPTPPDEAAGLETANAAFVRKLLAALVDSSPEALDTLNELAAALGNDPNFATTVTNALAGKQPLNDTLTSISKAGVGQNSLLYFGDNFKAKAIPCSNKARSLLARNTPESMRAELELKAAATMEPQTDIRDRTPGRLSLPGAFGFGKAFSNTEALTFNGQADFAEWLKEAMPGRYAVSIADSSTLLAGTTKFNGIIDVMWSPFDNDESDTVRKFKTLLCFNQYYEGEHSIHRLTYRWSGNNWNATVSPIIYDGDSLAFLLSRTAGSGSYFKYPAVGVPVLAVYRGTTSGDKEINIGLGDVVQGSQLGGVNLSCAISSAGVGSYNSAPSVGATGYTFPGRYMALSGVRDSKGITGRICLFVRIE